MNVYSKLQKCRVLLQNMNLQKSGENKFAGYDYFELCDFMPPINELFMNEGLFGQVSFTAEMATLTITNTDKPEEQIVFTSPMAAANLKGCHDIQNMGAVETYQRRYLYTTALEIVERDALDKTTGKEAPQAAQSAPKYQSYNQPVKQAEAATSQASAPNTGNVAITDGQIKIIPIKLKEKKVSDESYRTMLNKYGVESTKQLTKSQATKLIDELTKMEEFLPF